MILPESHFSLYIIYQKGFDHLCNILRKKKKGIVLEREIYTTRRLKSFPWDTLVYQWKHDGVLPEFGKIREIGMYHVMCIDEQVTCTGWFNVPITEFSIVVSGRKDGVDLLLIYRHVVIFVARFGSEREVILHQNKVLTRVT